MCHSATSWHAFPYKHCLHWCHGCRRMESLCSDHCVNLPISSPSSAMSMMEDAVRAMQRQRMNAAQQQLTQDLAAFESVLRFPGECGEREESVCSGTTALVSNYTKPKSVSFAFDWDSLEEAVYDEDEFIDEISAASEGTYDDHHARKQRRHRARLIWLVILCCTGAIAATIVVGVLSRGQEPQNVKANAVETTLDKTTAPSVAPSSNTVADTAEEVPIGTLQTTHTTSKKLPSASETIAPTNAPTAATVAGEETIFPTSSSLTPSPTVDFNSTLEEASMAPTEQTEEPIRLTNEPTPEPTLEPTLSPSLLPTPEATLSTSEPSWAVTPYPTPEPTLSPSVSPTPLPTPEPTDIQTPYPTLEPTLPPTIFPTDKETLFPTLQPSRPPKTLEPAPAPTTLEPTVSGTLFPTAR